MLLACHANFIQSRGRRLGRKYCKITMRLEDRNTEPRSEDGQKAGPLFKRHEIARMYLTIR